MCEFKNCSENLIILLFNFFLHFSLLHILAHWSSNELSKRFVVTIYQRLIINKEEKTHTENEAQIDG